MAHLYWRISTTATNGGANLTIDEIQMRSTVGGADQCTGGTPSAQNALGINVVANAFDNTVNTAWQSTGTVAWIQYQFASAVNIVEYTISIRGAGFEAYTNQAPKNWKFYWSDDGSTWTEVDSQINQTAWAAGETRTFTLVIVPISITGTFAATESADVAAMTGDIYTPIAINGAIDITETGDILALTGVIIPSITTSTRSRYSPIDICNLALARIGISKPLAAITDPASGDEIVNYCDTSTSVLRLFYEFVIEKTLEEFPWNFATKFIPLTVYAAWVGDAPQNWKYVYEYPTDCVFARRVWSGQYPDTNATRVPFVIVDNGLGTAPVILCNSENAVLEYTFVVTDVIPPCEGSIVPTDYLILVSENLGTAPRMAVSFTPDPFTEALTFDAVGYNASYCAVVDAGTLYMIDKDYPATIRSVDIATMTLINSAVLPVDIYSPGKYASIKDGFMYVNGLEDIVGGVSVVKINLSNLTLDTTQVLSNPPYDFWTEDWEFTLVDPTRNYIYQSCLSTNGINNYARIVKLDSDTLAVVDYIDTGYTLKASGVVQSGYVEINSGLIYNDFLYVGLSGGLAKIDLSDFTTITYLDFAEYERIRGLCESGGKLYASNWFTSGDVYEIDPVTMTIDRQVQLLAETTIVEDVQVVGDSVYAHTRLNINLEPDYLPHVYQIPLDTFTVSNEWIDTTTIGARIMLKATI